jgi:hypothetical protein
MSNLVKSRQLNLDLAAKESKGEPITPPGLPSLLPNPSDFLTEDRNAVQ